jgi:hypothetical protein
MHALQRGPFDTSEDVAALTRSIQVALSEDDATLVVDTPGLEFVADDVASFVRHMRLEAQQRVNSSPAFGDVGHLIDWWLVFVINPSQPKLDRTVSRFQRVQAAVFHGSEVAAPRSLLVVNKCSKGWLAKPRQLANKHLQELLALVQHRVVEVDLKFDHWSDSDEHCALNNAIRQRTVDELLAFVLEQTEQQRKAERRNFQSY